MTRRPQDQMDLRSMADGGEGILDVVRAAIPASQIRTRTVRGPLRDAVEAPMLHFDLDGRRCVLIELAAISGLERFPRGHRIPGLDTHTVGVGEMIALALEEGAEQIFVGLGGSSSTDAGTGLLRALGARFVDAEGRDVPLGAGGLACIASAELGAMRALAPAGVIAFTDVHSPATGAAGAARVFGPQKGIADSDIGGIDAAIAQVAELLGVAASTSGSGAAGAAALGLLAWGARLESGARSVAQMIDLPGAIADADLVVTGEGSFDGQSAAGKAPSIVAELARAAGVPVAVVAGTISDDAPLAGLAATVSLTRLAGDATAAMADPERYLRAAGAQLAQR